MDSPTSNARESTGLGMPSVHSVEVKSRNIQHSERNRQDDERVDERDNSDVPVASRVSLVAFFSFKVMETAASTKVADQRSNRLTIGF